jgi:hypothetical protein
MEKCPIEALVLLDEALQVVDKEPVNWPDTDKEYQGPYLSDYRCVPNRVDSNQSRMCKTWTVGLDTKELLEWWDDHWVHVRLHGQPGTGSQWPGVWRGTKATLK